MPCLRLPRIAKVAGNTSLHQGRPLWREKKHDLVALVPSQLGGWANMSPDLAHRETRFAIGGLKLCAPRLHLRSSVHFSSGGSA